MNAPQRAIPADRLFYTGMALISAVIVFLGFSPTFFQRSAELPPLGRIFVVHGIAFSAWIAFFVVQTSLIAANQRGWHRTLGALGVALAAAMVVLGTLVAIESLNSGMAPVPGMDPRPFFAIPMHDIVVFPIYVGAAIWFRRDAEMHKRLMLMATITLLAAAIARTGIPVQKFGPPLFYGLQDLLIVVGMLTARHPRGAVHRAYWWGLGLMVGSQVLFLAIARSAPWLAFAGLFMRN